MNVFRSYGENANFGIHDFKIFSRQLKGPGLLFQSLNKLKL